jgi:Fe2+ or Zn2+ uptake regulation protein
MRERGDSDELRLRDQGSMIAIKETRRHPFWSHNHLVRECCGVVEEAAYETKGKREGER